MQYEVKLYFECSQDFLLLGSEYISLDGKKVSLARSRNDSIKQFVFAAKGFERECSAQQFGERLEQTLGDAMISENCSVKTKLEIVDLNGPVKATSNVSTYSSHNVQPILDFVKRKFDKTRLLNDRLRTAKQLYHNAGLSLADEAKLIESMSVIEWLAPRKEKKDQVIVDCLEKCKQVLQREGANLKEAQIKVLNGIFDHGKNKSTKQSGAEYCQKICEDGAKKFKDLWDYRGRIAHPRGSELRKDLPQKAEEALELAGDALRYELS